MATSRIIFENGRPVILFNGQPIPPYFYSDPCINYNPRSPWADRVRDFANHGAHLCTLNPDHGVDGNFWQTSLFMDEDDYRDAEDPNLFTMEKQAAEILSFDSEALFYVRFGDNLPPKWYEKHPEAIPGGNAKALAGVSLASDVALHALGKYIRCVISCCERSGFRDRLVGYFYFPAGEGINEYLIGYPDGSGRLFDDTTVMCGKYREYLADTYGKIERLNSAWNAAYMDFNEIETPNDTEWRDMIAKELHVPDPKNTAKYRDYFTLLRNLYDRWYRYLAAEAKAAMPEGGKKLFGIDFAKTNMTGWQICAAFHGDSGKRMPDVLTGSGCGMLEPLLDDLNWDWVITPSDYTARNLGFGFDAEGVTCSLNLRGKIITVENDSRTYLTTYEKDNLGAFRNPKEVLAGSLRNFAWALTNAQMAYWMNVGSGFFNDETIQQMSVDSVRDLLKRSNIVPHRETEHAIALIIDDTAGIWENYTPDYQNIAVLWQRLYLSHCGIPYRVYLFSDLKNKNMPEYRCYLFPNLIELNDEKEAILKSKVLRGGKMAVFGPLTGVIDGDMGIRSSDRASKLFGVEMELCEKQTFHRVILNRAPALYSLPANLTYGDSLPYGPLLMPALEAFEDQTEATVLGDALSYWEKNRAGAFVRRFEDYRVAYSFAMPMPPELLRALAAEGGCHVWSAENDVILACESIVAINATKSGKKIIALPQTFDVYDMQTNELVEREADTISMQICAPQTKIFELRQTQRDEDKKRMLLNAGGQP